MSPVVEFLNSKSISKQGFWLMDFWQNCYWNGLCSTRTQWYPRRITVRNKEADCAQYAATRRARCVTGASERETLLFGVLLPSRFPLVSHVHLYFTQSFVSLCILLKLETSQTQRWSFSVIRYLQATMRRDDFSFLNSSNENLPPALNPFFWRFWKSKR